MCVRVCQCVRAPTHGMTPWWEQQLLLIVKTGPGPMTHTVTGTQTHTGAAVWAAECVCQECEASVLPLINSCLLFVRLGQPTFTGNH